jgi:acetyl esterase/lipase
MTSISRRVPGRRADNPNHSVRRRLVPLIPIIVLAATIGENQPSLAWGDDLPFEQQQNVVYGEGHGVGLLMDVFRPTANANGLGIIDVASGAWYSDRGKIRDHMLAGVYDLFCERGYTVFAVRPGSRPKYSVPDMLHHLGLAVQHIQANAQQYGVDPDRLGITGASAGGHLAALVALSPTNGLRLAAQQAQALPPENPIRAAGLFFPPTDLLSWDGERELVMDELLRPLLFGEAGSAAESGKLRSAAVEFSPLRQVSTTPTLPFLLIHGDADQVVPLSHSTRFVDAVQQAGGHAELIVKPGGGHPWLTIRREVQQMVDWFDRHMAPVATAE